MTIPRKRGRPIGTGPNQAHDERLLRQAARQLFYGFSPNATAAFCSLLEQNYDRTFDDDDRSFQAALRRLQRQWQRNGEKYREEARRTSFSRRWKFEADQLEKTLPELSRVIDTFAASAVGKAVLLKYGKHGIPAEPMSLGIATLWEEIVRHSAVGPLRAEEVFGRIYADWSATGLNPDEAFLRRFAELCARQADKYRDSTNKNTADGGNIDATLLLKDDRDEL